MGTGAGSILVIRAAGSTGEEAISLLVGGVVVQDYTLGPGAVERSFTNYGYEHFEQVRVEDVVVRFTNNGTSAAGADRNVRIDHVSIDGLVFQTEAPETFSTGSWAPASGCAPGNKETEWIHCTGEFRYG